MNWTILNPYSSTGFLLRDAGGPGPSPGKDLLIDMEGGQPTFAQSLAKAGSAPERIAHLFLTHHHPDHLYIHDALALARQGTHIYIGQQSWLDALESFDRLKKLEARDAAQALAATPALHLLPPAGEMTLAGRIILWRAFPHGDGDRSCENLAFAFDDHVFSGDTSIRALFDPTQPTASAAAELLGLNTTPRRVLCLDLARLSREEVAADPALNPRRRRNYCDNHGILEDFLAVLEQPRLRDFFGNLRTLVPHHLRRAPLPQTAQIMREKIHERSRKQGFQFAVHFPDLA